MLNSFHALDKLAVYGQGRQILVDDVGDVDKVAHRHVAH